MKSIFDISIIGFLVGMVGTGLGGICAMFIRDAQDKFLSILLGITGGFMLSIVNFELLPQSYILGGIWNEILGILLGMFLIIFAEEKIPENKYDPLMKSSLILAISIGIHNLPEGLAIGFSFMAESNIGYILSLAMFIHNLPEGLTLAIPLKLSKVPNLKILLITILAGLPTGIGAFIGAYLGNISNIFVSLCLSFAGGAMLYIICSELIPNAKALHSGRTSTIGIILGFILGLFFAF